MFDPSSFANPTPLAHADTSRDVLPKGGTSQVRILNAAVAGHVNDKHLCPKYVQSVIDRSRMVARKASINISEYVGGGELCEVRRYSAGKGHWGISKRWGMSPVAVQYSRNVISYMMVSD
ncbi:hypothetical protein TNCV_1085291 [Trichonephila clavipes]|nr:hypothetical protein TNCV_1085291 [Trichonephila clavipes]